MIFTKQKLNKLEEQLEKAKNIVVLAHQSPDGDAVGSSLALCTYLKKIYKKEITVCLPDPVPKSFHWLTNADDILSFHNDSEKVKELISAHSLVFNLDYNQLSRAGEGLEKLNKENSPFNVMIDHHLFPSDEFDISFSDPKSCATAQMIYDFIVARGHENYIDEQIGEMIYCGIMTDTGSFRFPSTTAHTHRVIAHLLEIGTENAKVHEAVYDNNSINRLRLRARVIENMEIIEGKGIAILKLSEDDMKNYNYEDGDADGLVNVGLSIQGIDKAMLLKQRSDVVKISFRSKGKDNPVNEMASKYFSGGGHANAAGGIFEGSIEDTVSEIKKIVDEFSLD